MDTPLYQLQQQVKHYELSAVAFRRDADAYHAKTEDAMKKAEQYKEAVKLLEQAQQGE